MPTLKLKEYAVRDARSMRRLMRRNYLTPTLAQRDADKLNRKGASATVVPVEG